MKNLPLKIFSTDPIPNPILKELLRTTRGTQLATIPTMFLTATGLGPFSHDYAENYDNKQFHKSVGHH